MHFVTGGTGFVGSELVRQLAALGDPVRVLARPTSDLGCLEGLAGVEVARGDLLEPAGLKRAMAGCTSVFHLGAQVSLSAHRAERTVRVAVEGTRNVLVAASALGIGRIVHVSTIAAVAGHPRPVPVTEDADWNLADLRIPYLDAKRQAEELAREFAGRGLHVTIVNPTAVIGPSPRLRATSNNPIIRFLERRYPACPPGGTNYVDIRDVAASTIRALERGRPGERCILGGTDVTHRAFFALVARVAGMRAPLFEVPYPLLDLYGWGVERISALLGRRPAVTRNLVRLSRLYWFASSDRARERLGHDPRPLEQTVAETVALLRGGGDPAG